VTTRSHENSTTNFEKRGVFVTPFKYKFTEIDSVHYTSISNSGIFMTFMWY